MVNANSSAVTSDSVRMRQCWVTLAWSPDPEIRPTTVWVLRTSIASSTMSPRRHQVTRARGNVRGIVPDVGLIVVGVDEHYVRLIRPRLGIVHRRVGDHD